MAQVYTVVLESYPANRREHIERLLRKHNRALDHHAIAARAAEVASGTPRPAAQYRESHAADHVVAEIRYHGGQARVEAAEAAVGASAAS